VRTATLRAFLKSVPHLGRRIAAIGTSATALAGTSPGYVFICVVIGLVFAPLRVGAAPWLFVSDVHLDPASQDPVPVAMGVDTNGALLASALRAMRAVDPDAPVVFITGDFFAHHFHYATAPATMARIAREFGRAFPHAQFVIALGNEDSECGDYRLAPDAPFLRDTATVWARLVDPHGEAPDFVRTFSHNGSYVTRLPSGISAFVADDVFWSPWYRAGCGGNRALPDGTLDALARAFPPDGGRRRWVVAHIPPGIDAFSSVWVAHRLAAVPFLRASAQAALLALLTDDRRGIALLLDAHTHKFAYRIAGASGRVQVPVLLIPSVSPYFGNAPSFLTVDVAADGTIRDASVHAYNGRDWRDIGGLHSLGLPAFTAPELAALQARLARDPELRAAFAQLYDGGVAQPEIDEHDWRAYWCTATGLTPAAYRDCVGSGGVGLLTARGVSLIAVGAVACALLVLAAVLLARRRGFAGSRGA
jgi:sphingomyelin phosphodiesterase acid-like 3